AVERELRHHEQCAAHLVQAEVHPPLGVGEEAEAEHLVGHPDERLLAVTVGEADEQQEATVDPAGHAARDPDFGARDALQERAHASVRDYSTVTDLARLRGWSTSAPRLTAM